MPLRFANADPSHGPHGLGSVLRWAVGERVLGRRRPRPAGPPADRVVADLERIRTPGPGVQLTWIGHASFLCAMDGMRVLIDPVFSARIGGLYPRHAAPGLRPADLPAVDLVLITHNHYDHLDAASLRCVTADVPVVVPVGLGRWFRRRGHTRVHELRWWDSMDISRARVTLVPARHWSKRGVFDLNASLWGGFVIASDAGAVYHAGDTAWFDGFAEIGRRFSGLHAAMLPIGGYEPAWFMEHNHLNPEQAGEAFRNLGARVLVPMHWGTFSLTDEPLREPPARLRAWWAAHRPRDGRELQVLATGETVEFHRHPVASVRT